MYNEVNSGRGPKFKKMPRGTKARRQGTKNFSIKPPRLQNYVIIIRGNKICLLFFKNFKNNGRFIEKN